MSNNSTPGDCTVSIVVACYQVAPFLRKTLKSLRRQDFDDFEVLMVDDASTDATPEICASLARRDSRFRHLRQPRNGGLVRARRAGLAAAAGTYVWHIDGDDMVPPGALAALVDAARRDDADIVRGRYLTHTRRGLVRPARLKRWPAMQGITLTSWPGLASNPFGVWMNLCRTEFVRRLKGASVADVVLGEDLVFNATAFAAARKITLLDRPVYHYRRRYDDSLTNPADKARRRFLEDARAHGLVAGIWAAHPAALAIFALRRLDYLRAEARLCRRLQGDQAARDYLAALRPLFERVDVRRAAPLVEHLGFVDPAAPRHRDQLYAFVDAIVGGTLDDMVESL